MNITEYAQMVKISLTEAEQTDMAKQADTLIGSFEALSDINTEDVDVLVTVLDITNVFRDDVTNKTITRETLLSNAPEQYGGYFQVPKAIE
jgi:aspartyl-tRNA(Asn)/glutamyl-tRNA(Gln) amidotransferase subunit C